MNIDLSRLQIPELIVMAIAGVLLLLLGYRIKKVAFFILWFILGYNLMSLFMPNLNSAVPAIAESELWQILLPISGGLLLALLGFSIEKLCVGLAVFALTLMITIQYFGTDIPTIAVGAVIGIILGGLAVNLMKPAIIIATSLIGSYAITMIILTLANGNINTTIFYFPMLIGIAAIGAVVQFSSTKNI